MNTLKGYVKARLAAFVAHRVRLELAARDCHAVDRVAADPLDYHRRVSAEALAAGLGLAYGADIEGDVAEFGTMTGYSAAALARAIRLSEAAMANAMAIYKSAPKSLHLFDSFEGLPPIEAEADATAPHVVDGAWSAGACKGLGAAELAALVTAELAAERVHIHAGWFKETVRALPGTARFALVHLDGDLYASTIDVLDGLLGRGLLSPGALLFFDDWSCNRADPACGERRAFAEMAAAHAVVWSDRGAYGLFGHSLIVHGYRGATAAR